MSQSVRQWRTKRLVVVAACSMLWPAAAWAASGGKLVYEPLSEEAARLGRLEKYRHADTRTVSLALGDLELTARVPLRCAAYDAVPIHYELSGDPGPNERIAVQAVAFEDEARRRGRDLYDLANPGNMNIQVEYLGSRTGVFDPSRVSRLTQESRHEKFPPYTLEPLVRSGTVKRGNYLFFKFRITNVGDTILDAEGFGAWMAQPDAHVLNPDGTWGRRYGTVNTYERYPQYLYPGESFEQWISFWGEGQAASHSRTLPPGRYIIRYIASCRFNREWDWMTNMWGGKPWHVLEIPIEVAEAGADSAVTTREIIDEDHDRMTRYVRSFEEFMTSFRVYEREEMNFPREGTLHLQVAPWTEQVVLKLVGNGAGRIATTAVPVTVSLDHLDIRHNPDNPFVIERNGIKEAVFCTQIMPAMRATTQLGPEPETHLRERYREAIEAGVNLFATTGGIWHIGEIYNPNVFVGDIHAETYKHFFDVIWPELGIPSLGWGMFPPKTPHTRGLGEYVLGRKSGIPLVEIDGKTYSGRPELDVAHPDFPRLYAAGILFNYRRWGDQWYRTAEGDVLIDVEDTWGWLRDDLHLRYVLGPHGVRRFRQWVHRRYGSIQAVNEAWGTTYRRFEDIDPQAGHNDGGDAFGTDLSHSRPEYTNRDNPFHDWSPAVDDWDVFRTELRCDIYDVILRDVRRVIPTAQINLRTEGAIIPVRVPADSDTAHLRHVHYSQRRNALVAEVLERRGTFKYHSDYTTLPYTETEWRLLLRALREQGMRGNYLPQFCTARDMVLNDHYGRDFTIHYNLPSPRRAVRMHVLQAAFPVWRIMYEEGHLPGVLWEDFMCDGYVTQTQIRELRLFRERLDAAPRQRQARSPHAESR